MDKKLTKEQLQEELEILELQKRILEVKKEIKNLEDLQSIVIRGGESQTISDRGFACTTTPWYIGGTYTS